MSIDPAVIAAGIAAAASAAALIVQLYGINRVSNDTGGIVEQFDRTLDEGRLRTLNERFATAADRLGSDKPAAVRLAAVYAMAGLADDWEANRQTCVDVLCGYLRMPYAPDPGEGAAEPDRLAFQADRQVRHTAMRVIAARLRPKAKVSWQGLNLDFTGVVFDGADFILAKFSGGLVNFAGAEFSGGQVNFAGAKFSGALVNFAGAKFSGSQVDFGFAEFSGGQVDFTESVFSSGRVGFRSAKFSRGQISFLAVEFSGAVVGFSDAVFSSGQVEFDGAVFSSGRVDFGNAKFSGSQISFVAAKFSGSRVDFTGAEFSGGQVDFSAALDWSLPPSFDFGSSPPPAVLLPGISQADSADSSTENASGEVPETG
jgi:uncharacterized protein YjbI with pentapeptide repeats